MFNLSKYKIYKYEVMLLSDNTYQVIKYYQTFLYNFKAGLEERYLYYNYHNHIIHDNEEERNNFDTLDQAQQFILQSQQVKTLSEYEDLKYYLMIDYILRIYYIRLFKKLIKIVLSISILYNVNMKEI
ncbi:hypothetical protein [Macrococcus armenti]|uniref:hypothetical protein n=1 Tax=Macrococcus armenti TaxID=2875764 RepID=UPI001CCEDDA4|nr:hypothetical protein [Macrococcus armenti]UBH14410.1 hypothetical protein LAU44_06370 [Macrococcus armenti]UBH16770.1 hypothetical protein LAU39_06385 [Macrococcus armenti]UBH19033.1 hypothetical protein LAU40_06375 [Macrococcus armenti]